MTLKKSLTLNGNSWQLYLNKPITRLAGISSSEFTVLLTVEKNVLYVKKLPNDEINKYQDMLVKKLIKRGSGYGLNLPLPILELLEINPVTDILDVDVNNNKLIIKKSNASFDGQSTP